MTTVTTNEATGSIDVGALPSAPSLARRFIRTLMRAWGLADQAEAVDAAELLISEVTTNAVRATGRSEGPTEAIPGETVATIRLRARLTEAGLVVEVWDNSPDQPALGCAADDEEGGRGLFLVNALAADWGCAQERLPPRGTPGKAVWFRLALRPTRPAVPARRPTAQPLPRRVPATVPTQ